MAWFINQFPAVDKPAAKNVGTEKHEFEQLEKALLPELVPEMFEVLQGNFERPDLLASVDPLLPQVKLL